MFIYMSRMIPPIIFFKWEREYEMYVRQLGAIGMGNEDSNQVDGHSVPVGRLIAEVSEVKEQNDILTGKLFMLHLNLFASMHAYLKKWAIP